MMMMIMSLPTVASTTDSSLEALLKEGKHAFTLMSRLSTDQKNDALEQLATLMEANQSLLLEANQRDLTENADTLEPALYQRLKLDEGKLIQLIQGIRQLKTLPDPCGQRLATTELDSGLVLEKNTVPLGLIGIVFESRPDVPAQVLSLILKSGNAVVFKGGREAQHSNRAFMQHVVAPLTQQLDYLPPGWASMIESREEVQQMLAYPQYVDLVIPRGSNQLVQQIMASTSIPVLGHADGVCHQYVHAQAELDKALAVVMDSKCQYPSACNALETLLVDATIAPVFLPRLAESCSAANVTLHACPESLPYLVCNASLSVVPATEADWRAEYGNLTLAVKVVVGIEAAMAHINQYGSHHTDGILTTDAFAQALFLSGIDSSSVLVNASTRFADGFRYGLGAEVGISTSRTHARGPVGLEGLVSYKYTLRGEHHVVSDYVGSTPAKHFTHLPI
jgi:glutamate-5-semialdehyde dehydrogenase